MSINLKLQFVGLTTSEEKEIKGVPLVSKFAPSNTILDVLNHFQNEISKAGGALDILNRKQDSKGKHSPYKAQVQILNKRVSEDQDFLKPLLHYGVSNGSCLLRVSWTGGEKKEGGLFKRSKDKSSSVTVGGSDKTAQQSKSEPELKEKDSKRRTFSIFKPSESNLPTAAVSVSNDDNDLELSVDDAKRYQEILKKKALAPSPYVQSKLKKEKEEQESKQKETTNNVQIRIKFPDLSITQVTLPSDHTVHELIQFLHENILVENTDFKYNLVIPKFNYANNNRGKQSKDTVDENIYWKHIRTSLNGKDIERSEVLLKKLASYHQTSFIFETIKPGPKNDVDPTDFSRDTSFKGPFLKNSQDAKPVHELIGAPEPSRGSGLSNLGHNIKKSVSKDLKKPPKWMKLSKR